MKVTGSQILFSTKLFIAAMLAYWVAVQIGLTLPYWSMVTCCVCMNPTSGAIRSKAIFRFAATVGAGIYSLGLAAVFGSVPLVLMVAAGLTAVVAFGIAFLDRTPRSYGFQLFAITLMIVAVAGIDHPETMFDTAVARVTEICLGIVATTLVDAFIAPRSLLGSLRSNVQRWVASMEAWAKDVLGGDEANARQAHDRLRTLADITSLSQMLAVLRYDSMITRGKLRQVLAIQQHLLRMVPLLSAISGRIAGLGAPERLALRPSLDVAFECLKAGSVVPPELAYAICKLPVDNGPESPWQALVHDALASDIAEVLGIWSEVRQIETALSGKAELEPGLAREVRQVRSFRLTPDLDHALRMAAGILVAYVLLCVNWYATGWHQGANSILIGTVSLGFFGGGDEPGKAIAMFGRFVVLALTLAAGLNYGLLPLANNFVTFTIAMGLFMLPLGAWAAVNPMATLLLAFGLSNINLQNHYAPLDFAAFIESGLGALLGIFVAFFGAGLFRTWGARHQIQRFLRLETREISRLSREANPRSKEAYVNRALDRLSVMATRLAATGQIDLSSSLFDRLRAGLNVVDVRAAIGALDADTRETAERMLGQLRAEFDAPEFSRRLLSLIDEVLDKLWLQTKGQGRLANHALRTVAGLRIALFGNAPAWVPAS